MKTAHLLLATTLAATLASGTGWAQENTPAQETAAIQEAAIQTQEQVATSQAPDPTKCTAAVSLIDLATSISGDLQKYINANGGKL